MIISQVKEAHNSSHGEQENHHLISKTYIKPWHVPHKGIYVYNKNEHAGKYKSKNKLFAKEFYHSISVASYYCPEDIIETVFSFLVGYTVEFNGNSIATPKAMKAAIMQFDEWRILDSSGCSISSACRVQLKDKLFGYVDNRIETEWDKQFENYWGHFRDELLKELEEIVDGRKNTLDLETVDTLMKYITMFNWRSEKGNQQLHDVRSFINDLTGLSTVPVALNLPTLWHDCYTLGELFNHDYLLEQFDNFQHDKGTMYEYYKILSDLTLPIFVLSKDMHFLTSDRPAFQFINAEGLMSFIFVIHPRLLVKIVAKKLCGGSCSLEKATNETVEVYNKVIFEENDQIVADYIISPSDYL